MDKSGVTHSEVKTSDLERYFNQKFDQGDIILIRSNNYVFLCLKIH